jgi:hypothetical protein
MALDHGQPYLEATWDVPVGTVAATMIVYENLLILGNDQDGPSYRSPWTQDRRRSLAAARNRRGRLFHAICHRRVTGRLLFHSQALASQPRSLTGKTI